MGEKDDDDEKLYDQHLPRYKKKYVPGRGIQRYGEALKSLIPIRRKRSDEGTMPVDSAGLFATISSSWISKFMYKAYRTELTMEELPSVSPYDSCDYNVTRLDLLWKKELAKEGPEKASFSMVAWRFCRTRVLVSLLLFTCNILFGFLNFSLFMRKLLEYVQSGGGSYEEGMKWALLLAASESARVLCLTWTNLLSYRTGVRLRSACLTLLYSHIIDANNLETQNIGAVINIFSNDDQRIFDVIVRGVYIIQAPLSTLFVLFYVLWLLSPIGLLGMFAFVVSYPIQYTMSRIVGRYQSQTMKISDMRVRLMNEILDCIKLIKMYAWEKRFSQDLLGLRKMERLGLLKKSYFQSLNASMMPTIPLFAAMITYFVHLADGNNLTAAQVFPFSSFLNSRYRISLTTFRMASESIVSAGISLNRIKGVLLSENKEYSVLKPILKSQAVAITNGTFAYNTIVDNNGGSSKVNNTLRKDKRTSKGDKSEEEKLNKPKVNNEFVDILFDISFEAKKGKLIGICGHVGSGKSSLLLAALGQLRVSNGQVMRDGTCAYVSQQAWITNATLRENILFGEKFDSGRYNKAIHACNLSQDIEMMPGGDRTEIGEKGINLSGGQKQRVALARALYADRDIYLLDDPLSAVDSRVGLHIFHNLILGALRGKTILLVTHQIQYLNRCDDIYVMNDGKIIEHGTHDELMKSSDEYASMVAAISTVSETENEICVEPEIVILPKSVDDVPLQRDNENCAVSPSAPMNADTVQKLPTPSASLMTAENIQRGTIKAATYHSYITAAGGYCLTICVITMFVIGNASINFSSWWLSLWLEAGGGNTTIVKNNATILSDNLNDNPDLWYYQSIYAGTIGVIILTNTLRGLIFRHAMIGASTKIHNKLFEKIINCPMRFFDTTPSGRIQHLFSRDMDEVDTNLPDTLAELLQSSITLIFTLLSICLVFPWFTLPVCLLGVASYYVSRIFRVAIRDLKRMDNKSRAPVISFVTATVQGLSTIHAFGKEKDFVAKFTNLLDENSKYLFMFNVGTRWLGLQVEALSVTLVSITGFLVIIFQDQVPPALAGLALAFAFQIGGFLPFSLQKWSETETRLTSVEKISQYIRTLEPEGKMKQSIAKPPSIWPVAAAIKFINVSMAYGDGTPIVLRNVSFTVNAGEKIGIVGRTGSGKSSLTVALFRLVELKEGKIEIDDVDISKISLSQLRSKLSIIPQDPVLFSGTVRSNLDPFKLYTDAEIWKALEKTELKDRIQSITGQLEASVGFGGDNLSLGQRQLLCLSRALLRNSKILVLDEATAAVDPETEMVVQNTVQREFSNCTILTIAHRLQTVLALNRVLVMDDGKILEFDTPANLLGDPSSELSKLLSAAEQAEKQ